MIDPTILDLMQHMTRPAPFLMQRLASASAPVAGRAVDGQSHRAARWSAAWIARAEQQVDALRQAYDHGPVEPHHLAQLDHLIALLEKGTEDSAKLFRQQEKSTDRLLRRLTSQLPAEAAAFSAERDRVFKAWSRAALARSELILSLRALRARQGDGFRSGPIFDDPDALSAYLSAAAG